MFWKWVLFASMFFLAGCGGGGSGEEKGTEEVTERAFGVFRGSVVVGVYYRAVLDDAIREGTTDSEGKFEWIYFKGHNVNFSLNSNPA